VRNAGAPVLRAATEPEKRVGTGLVPLRWFRKEMAMNDKDAKDRTDGGKDRTKPAETPGLEKMQAQREVEKGKPEKGAAIAREIAGGVEDENADRTGRDR
jgi:hypothetical protein